LPCVILFVPEHAFNRQAALEREEKERITFSNVPSEYGSQSNESIQQKTAFAQVERHSWLATRQEQGWGPFWSQLRLFTGRKSNENPLKILLRPFPLMLHPAVLWGSLTQGTLIVFLVALFSVIAELFEGPPHFYSISKVGYFYVGPFIGGMIGFAIGSLFYFKLTLAGLLSDWLCTKFTKWNNRIFEPEFRIVLVVFQLISAAIGLFPFGLSVDRDWSFYVSVVLFSFITFALIMGATATGTYIVDAHLDMAVEAFVCITLFKNFVSFGMTIHIYNILLKEGNTKVWCFWMG
jgi:hypothetical protein